MAVRSWFPITEEWVQETHSLTVHEKLFSLWAISRANLEFSQGRTEFYTADLEVAVTVKMSEDKVRRARRKLTKAGWLMVEPGFRAKGRNLATRYTAVEWAKPPESGFFSQMHRHAFDAILAHLRDGRFTQADVLTYVLLNFIRTKYDRELDGDFFVSKRELREVTGILQAPDCVRRLHDGFKFSSGEPLFDFTDEPHRLKFSAWRGFADPANDEQTAKNAARWREEIAAGVSGMKMKVRNRARRKKTKRKRKVA